MSMGTISEEAPPERRAMHAGLITGCFMLIGLGLGSQAAGWLMEGFGSWRPVFYVVSAPAPPGRYPFNIHDAGSSFGRKSYSDAEGRAKD